MSHTSGRARRRARGLAFTLLLAALAACGGSDTPTQPKSSSVVTSIAPAAGDGQTVLRGTAVPVMPAVVVRDQDGQPMANVSVTFAVTAGGGTLTTPTVRTNSSGVATVGGWTLGATLGTQTVTATAQGGASPSTQISVTARPPRWTVMVYLAADNTLAASGVFDIDEMESAGVNPEVQVVVQAEFSPEQFALLGCDASCAHLSNFDTFRYALTGATPHVTGPDGAVTDIGNRNMTDPAQLGDFVSWAKTSYPAEHYALVLWNHGGGYTGLIEDVTSSGEHLMSLADVSSALTASGPLDLVDFDMCLMAGYETLASLAGHTQVATFSEEVEPGDGDPYNGILQALYASPTMTAQTLGTTIVDQYNAYYQQTANARASTTKSAYDLGGLAAFESALAPLAATLSQNVGTLGSTIGASVAASQKYAFPMLTDIGDVLDTLYSYTADATLRGQIAAVKSAAASPSFRLRSRARNGTAADAAPVDRSTGLHIVWPSGQAADALPDQGPASFAAYQALYPGKPWTQFLAAWLTGGSTTTYADQGANRFEGYLVWDGAVTPTGADLDLWILEPNGNLYIPFMGTVTPNGHLTLDSYDSGDPYEGYLTNRYIEVGRYKFYASLYSDPQDVQPTFDFAWRNDTSAAFTYLYQGNEPKLSLATSWQSDSNATFAQVDSGKYTDLRYAAYMDVAVPAPAPSVVQIRTSTGARTVQPASRLTTPLTPAPAGRAATAPRAAAGAEPQITRAQLDAARHFLSTHKAQLRRGMRPAPTVRRAGPALGGHR